MPVEHLRSVWGIPNLKSNRHRMKSATPKKTRFSASRRSGNLKKQKSEPPAHIDDIRTAPLPSDSITPSTPPSSCSGDNGTLNIIQKNESAVTNKLDTIKLKTADQLNWSDRDEVMHNLNFFEADKQRRFEIAERKRTEYPNGFDKGHYFGNLIPIIASGYVRADKILGCGFDLKWKRLPCDQWAFCSKCAYMRGRSASEKFKGTFAKDSFFHVTLGFNGDIGFDATRSTDARAYWKMNEEAIRYLQKAGVIHGAYLAHEIKIRSFLPLRINPHSHVVISASEFPHYIEEALMDMIGKAKGVNLKPSIEVSPIDTQTYHDRCFRYLTKEMNLQEAYQTAWLKHCADDRKMTPELNREMRVFLDAQAAAFGGMNRVVYMGNLRSQSTTSFIGVKKEPRKPKKKRRRKK